MNSNGVPDHRQEQSAFVVVAMLAIALAILAVAFMAGGSQ